MTENENKYIIIFVNKRLYKYFISYNVIYSFQSLILPMPMNVAAFREMLTPIHLDTFSYFLL